MCIFVNCTSVHCIIVCLLYQEKRLQNNSFVILYKYGKKVADTGSRAWQSRQRIS